MTTFSALWWQYYNGSEHGPTEHGFTWDGVRLRGLTGGKRLSKVRKPLKERLKAGHVAGLERVNEYDTVHTFAWWSGGQDCAFLRAIADNRFDVVSMLVYADFLGEGRRVEEQMWRDKAAMAELRSKPQTRVLTGDLWSYNPYRVVGSYWCYVSVIINDMGSKPTPVIIGEPGPITLTVE